MKRVRNFLYLGLFFLYLGFFSCNRSDEERDTDEVEDVEGEILEVSPTSVLSGGTLTIEGVNIAHSSSKVYVGGKEAEITSFDADADILDVTLPNNLSTGIHDVRVERSGGRFVLANGVRVARAAVDRRVSHTMLRKVSASEIQRIARAVLGSPIGQGVLSRDVVLYRMVYRTMYQGRALTASALISVPDVPTLGNVDIIGGQHGTITDHAASPTEAAENADISIAPSDIPMPVLIALLASAGVVVVQPDYIGFGKGQSALEAHPYYLKNALTDAVLHALEAGVFFAKAEGLVLNGKLILAGYSQGGAITLEVLRELEETPILDLEPSMTHAGAGAYDIAAVGKDILSRTTYAQPVLIAYLTHAYIEVAGLALPYDEIFQTTPATKIPSFFDKLQSLEDINADLPTDLDELLLPAFQSGLFTDPKYAAFAQLLENNRVLPANWGPVSALLLLHSPTDEVVPFSDSQSALAALSAERMTEEGEVYSPAVRMVSLSGTHVGAGAEFFIQFTTTVGTLKTLSPAVAVP